MSQSSLSILLLAIDAAQVDAAVNLLKNQGVDAGSLAITDSSSSDAEITSIVKSKNWDGYVVGKPIQQNQEWFARVKKLVQDANPKVAFVDPKSRDDLENAIETQFSVKFPITKA